MNKPKEGIAVDGMTAGNPGPSRYKGVDLSTGKVVFESDWIGVTTNNITEFLAICHAVHYLRKNNLQLPIYSDSQTAIAWATKKRTNSSCKELKERVNKACEFLKDSTFTVEKWHTVMWGEIPADFGRKK